LNRDQNLALMNAIFIYVISTKLYSITLFDISFKFDITVCEMSVINCIEIFVFSVGSKTLKLKISLKDLTPTLHSVKYMHGAI